MFRCIKGIAFFAIFIFLFGFITMSLWNALVPDLFHGPMLTYWQALGFLVLAKIFFGGFYGRGRCHGRHRHWSKEWGDDCSTYNGWRCWGGEWEEKFKNMTPEEREDWKRNMKNQWKSGKGKMGSDAGSEEANK